MIGSEWSFVYECTECSAVYLAEASDVSRTNVSWYYVECPGCAHRRVLSVLDLPEHVWMMADLKETNE